MDDIPRAGDGASAVDGLRSHGAVVVESVLGEADRADLAQAVTAREADHPLGRNVFEGQRSHRLYSLIARGRPFERLAGHDLVAGILDAMLEPNWLLSNCQSIRLYPGETHQPWHTDDGFYPIPRPRPFVLGISTIWAIDAFTSANGATELWLGSHRWADEHPDSPPSGPHDGPEPVTATMGPGSVLVFDTALWHRGGANRSDGTRLCLTNQYCQPWLRPQESQLLIAPPGVARALSPRVQAMLGYSIHPPFIGQVEGKHPLRLVDEGGYRAARGNDAARADAILARPGATFGARADLSPPGAGGPAR